MPIELLTIVVPVYNEASTVRQVIDRLLAIDLPLPREIIVVNDGSTDGTREVLDALDAPASVRVVHAPRNQGKGSAIRTGFAAARGDVIAIQDADLELDPVQLASLVQPIVDGETTVVYGSRFLNGRPDAPWLTIAANRVLTGFTNILFGSRLTDMETCYKIMRADVARGLALTSNRFDIEPEITARLLRQGHRILERPVQFSPRSRAQGKKIGWRDGWRAMVVLASHRLAASRSSSLWTVVAIVGALAIGAYGTVRNTWAVGGSDSSCYALMAEAFAAGRLQPTSEWARGAPWPDAAATLVAGGFVPSEVPGAGTFAASPVCAPGYAAVLAPFKLIGGRDAIFLVTPLAGMLLVWLTFVLTRRLGGPAAGALAVVLVATSPVVLFQVTQPMNDITTAALWTAVLAACAAAARRPGWIGVLVGLALLVRPNLAPAAIVVAAWLAFQGFTPREPPAARERSVRSVLSAMVPFVIGAAPLVAAAAFFNDALYGAPWRSGYGSVGDLFSPANVSLNIVHHGRALVETQTPIVLLAAFAPWACERSRRSLCWLGLFVIAAILAVYLPYRVYDEWWYLRFLLPALAIGSALASVVVARIFERAAGRRWAPVGLAAVAVVVGLFGLRMAAARQAFSIPDLEQRFRLVGTIVATRVGPDAVAITGWDSGSLRYHAGARTLLWGALDPDWLDRSVEWLQDRGYAPVIVLERWEEPVFRERFGERSALGRLDWPPRFDIDRQVRVFDPADRAPYFAGALVPTEIVR